MILGQNAIFIGWLQKKDMAMKKELRKTLEIGEYVFVLAERLKSKDAPGRFLESTTENKPIFNNNKK